MAVGRGRKSNIELLPRECSPTVIWAASELQDTNRTQLDIYGEFVARLEAVLREHRGELEFTIPSFSAFNRHSVKLDAITRDMTETREIAAAIASKYDAKSSDDLTLITAEAIKGLVFQMITMQKGKIDPKGLQALSNALRAATQARDVSTSHRQKVQKEFDDQVIDAVDTVAKIKGLTQDTVADIKAQILGVQA